MNASDLRAAGQSSASAPPRAQRDPGHGGRGTKPVSVIVVTYNSAADIGACVESVAASSVPTEIIVVDNASRDATVRVAEAAMRGLPQARLIANRDNLGFAAAVNIGLRAAQGDFFLLLNPDSILRPDTIERALGALVADPKAGMAGCLLLNPDGTEQAGARRYTPTPWRSLMRVLRLDRVLHHPRFGSFLMHQEPLPDKPTAIEAIAGAFMLVRREALEQVGPMDEGYFLHCEDLDWCLRFRKGGWNVLFVPDAVTMHRKGRSSAATPVRVEYYKHKGMLRFYAKHFRHQYPGPLMWLVYVAVWARFGAKAVVAWVRPLLRSRGGQDRDRAPADRAPAATARDSAGADVAVFGAHSQIGYFLLPALVGSGHRVLALSRGEPPGSWGEEPGVAWLRYSAEALPEVLAGAPQLRSVVHIGPLGTLAALVPALAARGVRRVIGFSSTGRFYKEESGDPREREVIASLVRGEEEIAAQCGRHGVEWTVFRPTLIYGCGMDKSITFIAGVIRRFGLFPLVGGGRGLRQPVHAADLARACLLAMENPATFGKAYNLSGGNTLSYRDMVSEVFRGLGRSPRLPDIPLPLFRLGLGMARLLPRFRHLSPEMASRMNVDMCFDHAEARRDFGYEPRPFTADDLALGDGGPADPAADPAPSS